MATFTKAPRAYYSNVVIITPSDVADLDSPIQAFIPGTAGTMKVTTVAGETVVLPSVLAGVLYPIAVTKIFDTDTTATSIAGLA